MKSLFAPALISTISIFAAAQVPLDTQIQIVKAEDARAYGTPLEALMADRNADVRTRAALAAGRIGDEKGVPALAKLLDDASPKVGEIAAFALGEIESIKAADAIIIALGKTGPATSSQGIQARLVEAAGKIAAANAKEEKSKELGRAIVRVLEAEHSKGTRQNGETVLLGITAVLRAKPENGEVVAAKFLTNPDARIRADAANTLSRLRAKNANAALRSMVTSDADPVARANAARALGSAEDKESLTILLSAVADPDQRVRVSAIRSIGSLKETSAAAKLTAHGERLLLDFKRSRFANPVEKSELLELASALGRLIPSSADARAVKFLSSLRDADKYRSPETEIAFAQVSPGGYLSGMPFDEPKSTMFGMIGSPVLGFTHPHVLGNFAQGLGAIAAEKTATKENIEKAGKEAMFLEAVSQAAIMLGNPAALALAQKKMPGIGGAAKPVDAEQFRSIKRGLINGFPEILRALAKLKPEGFDATIAGFLLNKPVVLETGRDGKTFAAVIEAENDEKRERPFYLLHQDPIVRATAAELITDITNINSGYALADAYDYAVANDTAMNDTQLAILDAAAKQPIDGVRRIYTNAVASPDSLIRQRAAQIIRQNEDLKKVVPGAESAAAGVEAYDPRNKTKIGQVLNTDADYRRALSRRNGTVSAILTTDKGAFTIDLLPEDAPLTVDNFVKLARSNYFNGVEVHRVVANFVMQDGDPRGDGNGGPGWSIRCEVNMVPYERGAVGMALSGKDTGGSQWFVTHAPQPHLDGGYTVFGRVNETGMKVVDNIVRGDKIVSIRILENILPPRRGAAERRTKRN